jgi:ATP-dependent protease ClpP protease subunit
MSPKSLIAVASVMAVAFLVLSATFFLYPTFQERKNDEIMLISVNEEITDTTTNYVQNAINIAKYRGSRLIVMSLNTPGGYVSSVEAVMSAIDESDIPVVIFVEHRAVSGGTYMLMASHVAVMKSSSQIGSCQPVDALGQPITDSKYINYLTELMRNHAWLHTRNETAAQLFVKENLNLNGEQAYRFKVADLIADDLQDMLSKLSNYVLVKYKEGEVIRFILTTKAEMNEYEVIQSWDFKNINETTVKEYKGTIEALSSLSYLLDFPVVLAFPILLLLPYIYPVVIVPILSLAVSPSLETIIAILFAISGIIGIIGILWLYSKEKETPQTTETIANSA